MKFPVGEEFELRWHDEAGEFWRRVYVVEPYKYSNGTGVWVKIAADPGNSFPVAPGDLRPLIDQTATSGEALTGEGGPAL